ncbi:MAG: hypothetical protein ACREXR_00645 [Gammaproteobacteria bacterium]
MTKVLKKADKNKELINLPDDGGNDFGRISSDDVAMPMLVILQDLSRQVKPRDSEFNPDAKVGMILNSVTGEVFPGDGTLHVVPCALVKTYVEWVPRTQGGGFVASHKDDVAFNTATRTDKIWVLPNGNEIAPTMMHYGLVVTNGHKFPAVIPMSKTQLRQSRKWIARMQMQSMVTSDGDRSRIFHYKYPLITVVESKDQYSWYGWRIGESVSLKGEQLCTEAQLFTNSLASGAAASVDMSALNQAPDLEIHNDVL